MKTFESNFEGADANSFYVCGWKPESDSKPKAVVALIHGLGEHIGRYEHVAKALTDAGYVLAGFDLRGHGKSGGARGHFPSLDTVMDDITRFRQFLSTRYADLPQFIYGHSLGGLLTLTYTLQNRSGLQGAIVTSPGLRTALQEQKGKIALVKMLGGLLPTVTVPSDLDVKTLSRDPQVVQKYVDDPLVHYKTSLGFGRAGLSAIDYCFAHAREYSYPLLLMHGKADRLTYSSGSEDFARLASEKNKDLTLKLWDGLYHETHNEPEKAEVIKTMIEWLDKHSNSK